MQRDHEANDDSGSQVYLRVLGNPALSPVLLWLIAISLFFHPTFLSGFRSVQGDLGDSRLVNFTLEHSYRWLNGMPLAEDLWSPPLYYPTLNAATYTDPMLGVAPLYWPWRWLGCHPHTAYQCWMLICWSLNFFCFYLLLRKGFRTSPVAASAGAFLFAFASPRLANVVHQQLVVQFYLVVALLAAIAALRADRRERTQDRAGLWIGAFCASLVLQLYTAFYPFFFFLLGLMAALAVAMFTRNGRSTLRRFARHHVGPLTVSVLAALGAALPLLMRYYSTAEEVGLRSYNLDRLPHTLSWFLMGGSNWLYGWIHAFPSMAWAQLSRHHNGVGAVTTTLALFGLWHVRRNRVVQLILAALAGLFLLTLRMPGDWSLWEFVRSTVPGAAGIRAVSRVAMMLLFPAAIGLAVFFDRLVGRRRFLIAGALFGLVVAEQIHQPLIFDKELAERRVAAIAGEVPRDARAFLLVNTGRRVDQYVHDDAAWVSIASGIPTINGRYGNRPRGWRLRQVLARDQRSRDRIKRQLKSWIRRQNLAQDRVAWIEFPARSRPQAPEAAPSNIVTD
jgi:hypothetical protein